MLKKANYDLGDCVILKMCMILILHHNWHSKKYAYTQLNCVGKASCLMGRKIFRLQTSHAYLCQQNQQSIYFIKRF